MLHALWLVLRVVAAVAVGVVLYLIAARSIANFSKGEPPPDPSERDLEDVDYRYRCIVCGAQVVMYSSQSGEVPEAPRHCREPMVLMAPIDDTGPTP